MAPDEFLKQLKANDSKQYELVQKLRKLIAKVLPKVSEEIKYGGLLFSYEKPVTGIFPYTDHVSLEFSHGADFSDPDKVLEGKGKHRRHLKFTSIEDLKDVDVEFFLEQA